MCDTVCPIVDVAPTQTDADSTDCLDFVNIHNVVL